MYFVQDAEYALVMQYPSQEAPTQEHDVTSKINQHVYDVSLVLTHNDTGSATRSQDADQHQLKLKFFVLMTSKNFVFPKQTLEKKLCVTGQTTAVRNMSASKMNMPSFLPASVLGSHLADCEVKTKDDSSAGDDEDDDEDEEEEECETQVHEDSVNYLGFSYKQQSIGYALLQAEVKLAREKINKMVSSARMQCRRDLLWQRMLVSSQCQEEENKRRRTRDKHSDPDDPLHVRLSFVEFEELLTLVERISLEDIDVRLAPLRGMSLTWYQGLTRVLTTKYSDHHRTFSSHDQMVQYVVVLNPKALDAFLLLQVDLISNRADVCAVYREADCSAGAVSQPSRAILNQHMEGVVNACCFHMWSGLL